MIFLQGRWYWKGKICETNIVGFGGTRLIIYFPLSDLSNDVIRKIDATSLHLINQMLDSMIEKVRKVIHWYERKVESEKSTFYEKVHSILIDR